MNFRTFQDCGNPAYCVRNNNASNTLITNITCIQTGIKVWQFTFSSPVLLRIYPIMFTWRRWLKGVGGRVSVLFDASNTLNITCLETGIKVWQFTFSSPVLLRFYPIMFTWRRRLEGVGGRVLWDASNGLITNITWLETGNLPFFHLYCYVSIQSCIPEGGGWKVSADVSCLTLTGVCCISTGISVAAALWPGHDDDDDDDDADDMGGAVAVAATGTCTGLDWLSHADDDVSVGCDSCRITWWWCDTDIVWAPIHTHTLTSSDVTRVGVTCDGNWGCQTDFFTEKKPTTFF